VPWKKTAAIGGAVRIIAVNTKTRSLIAARPCAHALAMVAAHIRNETRRATAVVIFVAKPTVKLGTESK